ncbi:hypothetical protein EJ05DRAFT_165243 [Pseudovirgaria hyperparasitica]|uniref:CBF1-interacting co-repressor CIR N-terminal domain-containing protein n=1 Tax=Pseudovirgaria hyperparasitica TaxID=470096 RepID=A0A6A6VSE4_9PEZI|nr:uncharacterized protein EJ05DRAFT_165243 [Pseudovirgaria hyperparasitica]KAF2753588.1 hypothetical protein EJ05DRAFT_165243 [Pseudovirgaria hyperparasitica]
MPLHLLGKKSWNVYNTDNIERVKRDEAIAAAHEEEVDRIMQEHDAAKRLAILRGVTPPRTPTPPPAPDFRNHDKPQDVHRIVEGSSGRERKKRKLAGEDDTDRDIRLARAKREDADAARETVTDDASRNKMMKNAQLYDPKGHMNLFAVDEKEVRKAQKEAEIAEEKRKKKQEAEQANSMRFSDAEGRGKALDKGPWYASGTKLVHATQGDSGAVGVAISAEEESSKNVWGRPDPNRKSRDASRVVSNDPLAFMKKAQVQLKQVEKDRQSWVEQREKEDIELRATAKSQRKHKSRRSRSRSRSLDGFRLDATQDDPNDSHERRYKASKHREYRDRSPRCRTTEHERHKSSRRRHHRSRSRDHGRRYSRERPRHRDRTSNSHHYG